MLALVEGAVVTAVVEIVDTILKTSNTFALKGQHFGLY